MSKSAAMVGHKFNRLTVRRLVRIEDGRLSRYDAECVCDCGTVLVVKPHSLRSGHTKSCGCWAKERMGEMRRTHGMSDKRSYMNWQTMIQRCHNPKDPAFKNYGGRGISVCERWRDSFENFYADMGARPSPKHSIDRINNDGNYEPANCRWATASEQLLNTRRSVAKRARSQT